MTPATPKTPASTSCTVASPTRAINPVAPMQTQAMARRPVTDRRRSSALKAGSSSVGTRYRSHLPFHLGHPANRQVRRSKDTQKRIGPPGDEGLRRSAGLDITGSSRLARDELALPHFADELPILDHHFAPEQDLLRQPSDFSTLVRVVVHVHVVSLGADGPFRLGIPDQQVGVRPHGDGALARG